MRIFMICSLIVSAFSLVHCKGTTSKDPRKTSEGDEIATTPVTGKIDGREWTFRSGVARLTEGADGEEKLRIKLLSEVFSNPCDYFVKAKDDRVLLFSLPRVLGPYSKSALTFNYKIDDETQNDFATDALFHVDTLSNREITGRLVGAMDNHAVEGAFKATICTDGTSDTSTTTSTSTQALTGT